MTGPEHYREAERILAAVSGPAERLMTPQEAEGIRTVTTVAQVHATLALAAATVEAAAPDSGWERVLS